MPGKLLVVGTPVGNLGDFPPRAVEALRGASVILCEDTRRTKNLLAHFAIFQPTERFDEHTETLKAEAFVARIEAGETVAIVSDAGMPVVSDPGFRLVRMARERGLRVEPIPGPFAGVLALVASGIAPLPFTFFGFAPARHGERLDFYRNLAELGHTAIVYESPERVVESLADALHILGETTEVTVARELTKVYEEILSGSLGGVLTILRDRGKIRGEITLVFGAKARPVEEVSEDAVREEFERLRAGGMRRNDAVKLVAEKFGLRKNDVYRMLL